MKAAPPSERVRDASALLLRRGDQFYLARRAPGLAFFGNFFAAVGGVRAAVDGTGDDRFAQTLARECLEELGLALFARRIPDSATRARLLDDSRLWSRLRGDFDLGALGPPACRLLTPEFYPRCFDTRFFLVDFDAATPDGSEPQPHATELVEGGWNSARGWIADWRAGRLLLVPPLVLVFERLVEKGLGPKTPPSELREWLAELGEEIESHPSQPIWNSPLARLVYLRTPTQPPALHTNTYLVGRQPAYVVDPATPHALERATLLRCIAEERQRGSEFAAILLTHDHPDHVGAAGWLRDELGLPIWGHARTQQQLGAALVLDRILEDGELLPMGRTPDGSSEWNLQCVHTPGHARGHLCFLDDFYRDVCAGDMVSTLSSILIDPRDGDVGEYLSSLRRLVDLQPRVVLPAHGPADGRGPALFDAQWQHRQRRSEQVLAAAEDGAESVEEVVERVYADVPAAQRALAGRSVISILRHLHRSGSWQSPAHDLARESGILPRS